MEEEYVEQGIENDEALSSDSLSYEEASEDVIEDSAPEELTAAESDEGEVEEGIEVPDEEVIEPEFLENAQEEVVQESRSDTEQVQEYDYSQQLEQILDSLNSMQGDLSLSDINENLINIDANVDALNRNIIAMDRNIKFHSRLEVGLLVAIWGSLLMYIAFSKLL